MHWDSCHEEAEIDFDALEERLGAMGLAYELRLCREKLEEVTGGCVFWCKMDMEELQQDIQYLGQCLYHAVETVKRGMPLGPEIRSCL